MKIAIDCRYLGMSGIGRYLQGILEQLENNSNEYLLIGNKELLSKYKINATIINDLNSPFSPKGLKINHKEINKCDCFYSPNFIIPFKVKVPTYTTIHDVIFLDDKETSSGFLDFNIKKYLLKKASKKSRVIFTVSEFSKKRIKHYFPKSNVVITYTSVSNEVMNYKKKFDKENQIVFVGNLKKNKNIIELLQAFEDIKDMKLIVIGDKNLNNIDTRIEKYLDNENIQFSGKVNDDELFEIISKSKFLIQPSTYEGFGLPPLEALYLNTRPIISSIDVFKEVYSDLDVIYYDGYLDLRNKIQTSDHKNVKLNNTKYLYKEIKEIIIREMIKDE